ncbi:hypothetical protein D3C80_1807740 [compost metagenome]
MGEGVGQKSSCTLRGAGSEAPIRRELRPLCPGNDLGCDMGLARNSERPGYARPPIAFAGADSFVGGTYMVENPAHSTIP